MASFPVLMSAGMHAPDASLRSPVWQDKKVPRVSRFPNFYERLKDVRLRGGDDHK
jgi:hypothetical protein